MAAAGGRTPVIVDVDTAYDPFLVTVTGGSPSPDSPVEATQPYDFVPSPIQEASPLQEANPDDDSSDEEKQPVKKARLHGDEFVSCT